MDPVFEDSIGMPLAITGFLTLMVASHFFRRWQRNRVLLKDGQLPVNENRLPTVEERVSKNPAWASGKITASGGIFVVILWICSVTWILTFGVAFINSISNPSIPWGGKIVLGVISLAGFVFIYFAVRFSIRHFRFGKSYLFINGKAGIIGKELSGTIRTSVKITAKGDHKLTLQCLETYTSGSGKNSRTNVNVLYQQQKNIPHSGTSSLIGIPFELSLPHYPPETGYQLSRGRISWQLKIETPVDGIDYLAIFTVPVFKID